MPSRAPPLVALRSLTIRRTIAVSLHPANITRAQTRHRHKDTLSVDPIQGEIKWAKMWRHGGRDMKLFGGKKGDEKAPMQGDSDEAGYYDSPVETVFAERPPCCPRCHEQQRGQWTAERRQQQSRRRSAGRRAAPALRHRA